MATTPTYINQRINNLQSQINAITPYPPIADSLASVLLIGNSAGATDINMNNQDILAVDNINLTTINGVAYPPVVAPDTLNAVLIAGNTATGTTAKITLNNTTAGGTANPITSLNLTTLVGTGSLVEEGYNQRNPVVGEFARKSFYSKTTTNVKTEYARITANAPVVTNGSQKGRLDIDINVNGTLTTYLSANGNTQQVDILKTLSMNGNAISVCNNITTQNSNTYGKNTIQFYTADASIPSYTPDDQLRLTMINEGVPDVVTPLSGSFPSTWGNILCSCDYNSSTYVGTDNGFIYYSSDGITWNTISESFNGAIYAMAVNQNSNLLYAGGTFTQTSSGSLSLSLMVSVDTAGNVGQVVWTNYASNGFNGSFVRCIEYANTGYLYIGGRFTADGGNNITCKNIAIVDSANNLYSLDNTSGYGFDNDVNFIKRDATNGSYFIVGGNFTTIDSSFGSSVSVQRNAVLNTNDYNLLTAPYEVVSMNAEPVAITQNGTNLYIGGNFTGLPFGDFLANFQWDGSVYQVIANPYGATPSAPLTTVLQDGGIFWTDTNGKLWEANVNVGSAPFGYFNWIDRAIWGQLIFSTNALAQNPTVAYFLFTSDVITLTLTVGTIYNGVSQYSGGIVLNAIGSVVDMIYQSTQNRWYVLTANNCAFF